MLQELVLKHIGHRLSRPLTFKWLLDVLHGHATEPAQVFLHLHTYTCMHTRTYTHANTHILVVYIGDIGDNYPIFAGSWSVLSFASEHD